MRTQAELERFALECAEELLARRAKLLVVACNTATSAALPVLRERMAQTTLGIDVLGVVQPGAVQAVAATTNGRVGLMATPATVASGAYAEAIALADPFVELIAVACPDLATIIEGGFPFDERVVETVRDYVAPLRAAGVDTVILGCTHYPLVAPMLQRMLGRDVRLVTAEGRDVLFEQRIAQHDQAVAITVDQELDALDGLASFIGGAMPESDHHVTAARAQLGVDRLQNRRVEGTLEDRDIDTDHLCRTRQ